MGLDIIYYRNLSYVEPYDENEDPVQDFDTKLHVNPDFPDRADDIEDGGMYNHYGQEYHFRVGPYSYYNRWRNRLAKLAGFNPDPNFDREIDAYSVACWRQESGPFWELISFSDCEGTIGPRTSKRIYEDFRKYRKAAENEDEEFLRTYSDFETAFSTASDNGAVVFC